MEAHTKKKLVIIGIIAGAIVGLIVFAAVIMAQDVFKPAADYLVLGDYENAYDTAKNGEKEDILIENMIAFVAKDVPGSLTDPSSFFLRDAWYDMGEQRIVLCVGGNDTGTAASSYWYYTYNEDDDVYNLFVKLTDFGEEITYSWDDSPENTERVLKNKAKAVVRDIINDSSLKLDKDSIDNINNLFSEDLLDEVELLKENKQTEDEEVTGAITA